MKYYCKCCDYFTERKSNFIKHNETIKHKMLSKSYPKVAKCYPNVIQNSEKVAKSSKMLSKSYPKVAKSSKKVAKCYPKVIQNSEKVAKSSNEEKKYPCKYCGKEFKYRSGVSKHIKYSCKQNKDEDIKELARLLNEVNEQNRILSKQNNDNQVEIEKMQKQISKLTKKLQIQKLEHVVNNTTNENSNNTVNYTINNYIDTDYSHLTERDYVKCIKDCNHCVKTLIEKVHFNKKKPENMNIYIPSMKDKYIMVYKNNSWDIQDRKEVLKELYDRNEWTLEAWYDEYKDKYPEIIMSFERYLQNKEEDDIVNQVKEKILMELYNKRDLVLDNKNYIIGQTNNQDI